MSEKTILDLYRHDFDSPRDVHYTYFYPGGSRSTSTIEFFQRTAALSKALVELGVESGDRVMLLSDNRPEWHQVDLATVALGAADVPIYGTLTPDQIAYQVTDSGARVVVAENPAHMQKFLEIKSSCPDLEHLIQIEGKTEDGVLSLDDVIGAQRDDALEGWFWDRAATVDEKSLLTLIYTSGTTGKPKGVMLSHRNLVQNVLASAPRIPFPETALALEFLPLCHVLERMVGYIYMWRATNKAYCSVYHVGDLIAEVKPTVIVGVPRFFEKVYDKIMQKVSGASGIKRSLFQWAVDTGREASRKRLTGKPIDGIFATKLRWADKLVLSKIREGMGGRLEIAVSGGAPLPLFVAEFFHALEMPILEGYGLTETSPVLAVNGSEPGMCRLGTVGKPIENVEIKIADDGEILAKGPNIMSGYWNLPEKTAEVFTEDGYFCTGDIGDIDDDGFLLITDRKKDLIVTGGGKNVAPQPVENELKRSAYIDNAVLIGDERPYIIALISPNEEELTAWAESQGLSFDSLSGLTQHDKVQELISGVIEGVNAGLARYEQIKKFHVLPMMLSVEAGQLTPTMKVKRRVVEQEYTDIIERLYEG